MTREKQIKLANALEIAVILCMFLLGFFLGLYVGIGENEKAAKEPPEIEEVCVAPGDKLWTICREYCPSNMDIRDYISRVEEYNGITADIYPGQRINVFKYS